MGEGDRDLDSLFFVAVRLIVCVVLDASDDDHAVTDTVEEVDSVRPFPEIEIDVDCERLQALQKNFRALSSHTHRLLSTIVEQEVDSRPSPHIPFWTAEKYVSPDGSLDRSSVRNIFPSRRTLCIVEGKLDNSTDEKRLSLRSIWSMNGGSDVRSKTPEKLFREASKYCISGFSADKSKEPLNKLLLKEAEDRKYGNIDTLRVPVSLLLLRFRIFIPDGRFDKLTGPEKLLC